MKIALLCAAVVVVAFAQDPGFTFRITPAGFDYANEVAESELNKIIVTTEIPDFEVEDGSATVNTKNMRITGYNAPKFDYSVTPGRIAWGGTNADIRVRGDWDGRYRTFLGSIRGSGTFEATARRASLQISIAFRRSSNNHLEMRDVQCSCSIGDLSLSIRGGFVGFILNIFSGLIARRIRPILQTEVCNAAKEFIEDDVNALLQTFPLSLPLVESYLIDYEMVADPEINPERVETFHRGEIRSLEDHGPTPFGPDPLVKTAADNSKMINFFASDFIINSLLFQGNQAGLLQLEINKDEFPDFADLLAFTCPPALPLCLGTIFPPLQEQFPDGFGEVEIVTTRAPSVAIGDDFGTMEGAGKLTVVVNNNGEKIVAVEVELTATGFLALFIKDGDTSEPKVSAVVELATLNIDSLTSHVGDIDIDQVQILLDQLKTLVTLVINSQLEEGIPIPEFEGIAGLKNTQLVLKQRTVALLTDVYINPITKH